MRDFWDTLPVFAVAIILVMLLQAIVRWRRAPTAFRAILFSIAASGLAGFVFGAWTVHVTAIGTPTASPLPVSEKTVAFVSTPHVFPTPRSPTTSREQALYVLTDEGVVEYRLNRDLATRVLSIRGDHTGLGGNGALAVDSEGSVYVVHRSAHTILRYAAGANGNVPPISIIAGPATMLRDPYAIFVRSDGSIYVADEREKDSTGCVLMFARAANGNSSPTAVFNTGESYTALGYGIAIDQTGRIWLPVNGLSVADESSILAISTEGGTDSRFLKGPTTGLDGPDGVALDDLGRLYVANSRGNSITVYPPAATGAVRPTQTIFGPLTGIQTPRLIAVDAGRQIYVASKDGILRFAPGSDGDVRPLGKIVLDRNRFGGVASIEDMSFGVLTHPATF